MNKKRILAGLMALLLIYGGFMFIAFISIEDNPNILMVMQDALLLMIGTALVGVFMLIFSFLFMYFLGIFDD